MTNKFRVSLISLMMLAIAGSACAQELNARFSCSATRDEDGEKVIYADNAEIHLKGDHIGTFRWESAQYRSTHGFDCSIDNSDGLHAEVNDDSSRMTWRVLLDDARAARERRGFDFSRGLTCTIRLERDGDSLTIKPSCPALCGSRPNFSELSVNLKTGKCSYNE